jgi:hypothetical protein
MEKPQASIENENMEQLNEACRVGDTEKVKSLLRLKVNKPSPLSAIEIALLYDQAECLLLLLGSDSGLILRFVGRQLPEGSCKGYITRLLENELDEDDED